MVLAERVQTADTRMIIAPSHHSSASITSKESAHMEILVG